MPMHDYTAEQALTMLIEKVRTLSPELAERVRVAVDAGSEMQAEEEEQARFKRGRKPKKHQYRKAVPYTAEQAVTVAVAVLKSHLVESRLAVNTAFDEFTAADIAAPEKPPRRQKTSPYEPRPDPSSTTAQSQAQGAGAEKVVEIETEPETVQEKKQEPNLPLKPEDPRAVETLRELMTVLEKLTTFKEGHHGNASGS